MSLSSAAVAVEKATSGLLITPDWTINIHICDSINSNHWQAKDVMKAVKRRLQHRSPKVQLLSLTLIETMVKNCGDYVHFQIAERNILGEMIKIVKKKADMNVRDKILALFDSWQEAFGGPGGKHPQYYWAYDELRRSGVQFPKRSLNAAPILTPSVSNPMQRITQAGYGMPSNSSRRLDETMATEIEGLSLSSLDAMRNAMELLNDMLQAVTPGDSLAVKDEVIVDLANRCRANQKMLMQMLTTTGDEELLGRGLELNDSVQNLLAKYDAIASGSVLPTQSTKLRSQPPESSAATQKASEARGLNLRDASPPPNVNNSSSTPVARRQIEEDDEEEDEFAQLARRHAKVQPVPTHSTSTESVENLALVTTGNGVTSSTSASSNTCTALALPDPPAPVKTSKEQDLIDLLSITLSTSTASPHTPLTPPAHQVPVSSSSTQGYERHHSASLGQIPFNSYVVPWAQPGPQVQLQSQTQPQQQFQPQPQQQFHPQRQPQPQPQQQFQSQPQQHLQQQFQPQPQTHQQLHPQRQPQPQQQFPSQPQQHLQQHFQPQPQTHQQLHPQRQPQPQQQFPSQPQAQSQHQYQPQSHPQPFHPQYSQYSSAYPPPPWAGSFNANHQSNVSVSNMGYSHGKEPALSTSTPARPLQSLNSFSSRVNNELAMGGGDSWASAPHRNSAPSFIPSYRLFEDLNVFGSADPRLKVTGSSTSSTLAGSSGQSMVGGRK